MRLFLTTAIALIFIMFFLPVTTKFNSCRIFAQEELKEFEEEKKTEKKTEQKENKEQKDQKDTTKQKENKEQKKADEQKPEKAKDIKEESLPQQEKLEEGFGDVVKENLKYYKKKYDETYNYPFEVVWASVKKSVADLNCQLMKENYTQNDTSGLFKGSIHTDYCVFSTGSDSTFKVLRKYSLKVPFIRGGVWVTGRVQFKFVVTERKDATVYLTVKGEISGFEEYVTAQVHFWESNGYLETKILETIKKNLNVK